MKRFTLSNPITIILKWFINTLLLFSILLFLTTAMIKSDFLAEQKQYERVKKAYKEKGQFVAGKLMENAIQTDELNILIVVYKEEQKLDIYAKNKAETSYKRISTCDICSSSGQPGPKRRKGDWQVPEGFYYIDRFNPVSNFFLSLGVNYPNESDRKKTGAGNPGGEIFIHGGCRTIGCIPITDERIKELYLYAIQARQNGQLKIPVYIFPFKMDVRNMNAYKAHYRNNPELLEFWDNLKRGYDRFEKNHSELRVTVETDGKYSF